MVDRADVDNLRRAVMASMAMTALTGYTHDDYDRAMATVNMVMPLVSALEYVEHSSWRCQYRSRYKQCVCGLDELCDKLGIERVPPNDPEARS